MAGEWGKWIRSGLKAEHPRSPSKKGLGAAGDPWSFSWNSSCPLCELARNRDLGNPPSGGVCSFKRWYHRVQCKARGNDEEADATFLHYRGSKALDMTLPCASQVGQNQWYHFRVGAPPILVYFSGGWDVHWGYGILTHGQVNMELLEEARANSLLFLFLFFAATRRKETARK